MRCQWPGCIAAILFANKRIFHFAEPLPGPGAGAAARRSHARNRSGEYRRVVKDRRSVAHRAARRRASEAVRPLDPVVRSFLSDSEAGALGVRLVALDELMARSDVVSIHAPALPLHAGNDRRAPPSPDARRDDADPTARGVIVDRRSRRGTPHRPHRGDHRRHTSGGSGARFRALRASPTCS